MKHIFYLAILFFCGCDPSDNSNYEGNDSKFVWKSLGFKEYTVQTITVKGDSFVLVGTDDFGGAFRSTNSGASWESINQGLPAVNESLVNNLTESIAVDSSGNLFLVTGASVYKSTNNGSSWDSVFDVINSGGLSDIACTSGYVFVSFESAQVALVRYSGIKWDTLRSQDVGLRRIHFHPLGHIFIANNSSNAIKSTDLGHTWLDVTITNTEEFVFNSAGVGFATGNSGLRQSTDNGGTWFDASPQTENYGKSLLLLSNDSILYSVNDSLFLFNSNTDSWQTVQEGFDPNTVVIQLIKGPGRTLYAATTKGLYVTEY